MNHLGFQWIPLARIYFVKHDIDNLMLWSKQHADSKCRGASFPGPGGFLHGVQLMFEHSVDPIEVTFTKPEIMTLAQICEKNSTALFQAFTSINEQMDVLIKRGVTENQVEVTMEEAMEALALRRAKNCGQARVNNVDLPAGSPMYYYCQGCEGVAAVLPEVHMESPPRYCPPCKLLKDKGWL